MKLTKLCTLTLTLICLSLNILAQEQQGDEVVNSNIQSGAGRSILQPKWNLNLDAVNFLLKGAGIEANYSFTEKVSLGAYGKGFKLMSEDYEKSSLGTKHEAQEFGTKLSYYSQDFQGEGWVTSLAVGQIKVKSTGRANFNKYSMSELNWEKSVTKSMTEVQGFLGYQFLGQRLSESSRIVVRGGLGYGTGGRLAVNYGGTESEIKNGLLLDLNAGIQF